MALCIGILVDDSIVVLENIHRHLMHRHDPRQTRIWVRNPADLLCACRSYPMMPPRITAIHNRTILAIVVIIAATPPPTFYSLILHLIICIIAQQYDNCNLHKTNNVLLFLRIAYSVVKFVFYSFYII